MGSFKRTRGATDVGENEGSTLLPHRRGSMRPVGRRRYGATTPAGGRRASSMPVFRTRGLGTARLSVSKGRELTVSEQTTKLAEEAKKTLFHGSFTSSHGMLFSVPPMRRQESGALSPARQRTSASQTADAELPPAKKDKASYRLNLDVVAPSALKKEKATPLLGDRQGSAATPSFITEVAAAQPQARAPEAPLGAAGAVVSRVTETGIVRAAPEVTKLKRESGVSASLRLRHSNRTEDFEENLAVLQDGEGVYATKADGQPAREQGVVVPLIFTSQPSPDPKTNLEKPSKASSQHISFAEHVIIKHADSSSDADELEETEEEGEVEVSYKDALMHLVAFAAPAALAIGFTFALSIVPLAFIGSYLGELALSGASVGYFILSTFVLYPMIGMTFALDTLCSHEYGRDPNSQELGLLLQRGIIINLVLLVPVCVLLYNVDVVLELVYGAAITSVAKEFLHYMPLLLLPVIIFSAFNKFLSNQMRPHMPLIALTAGIIITPYVQMKLTPMGVRYSMVGMCITAWFQLAVIVVLTLYVPQTRHTLGSLRLLEALNLADVKGYMELAIPSAIFVAAEASSFDVTVLLCAYFGEQSGAAWSSIMNVLFIFAALAGGLSAGACANIGRCVGSNEPKNARRYVEVAIAVVLVLSAIDSALLYTFFDFFMGLFGTKGETLQLARETLLLLPLFHTADAVQFTFQGIFSGLGKNHLGALILLLSLWGVGIPMVFFLGLYLQYGVFGVCLGMTIGLCIEAPAMVLTTATMNYQSVCDAFVLAENSFSDEEEDEEDEDEDEEDEEEAILMGDDVFRRSGIPVRSSDFGLRLAAGGRRLKAPPHRLSGR
ncbi:multidrug resistance protein, MATE family [Trypanosoma conorhini]|uniref:Multidrug resistance protein, MATE family n=1 Tax=Trypanosoma conorhini TaxID=83891 RepID=A0A3R7KMS3_9TRYP|nr:multidrug resistance protein, MATE family [Trypanosoma conorhini]RNF10521.1 multidrug resistance protein, MATE family [Trypanosoma conorhini]